MKITSTETLVKALRILSVDIESEDGAANAAIAEGAERINELAEIAAEMSDMLTHDRAMLEGCRACAIRDRLDSIGVRLS